MPLPTYAALVRRFGLAFRPDAPAYAYGDHINAYRDPPDREAHDAVVRAAFALFECGADGAIDPYDAALVVWHADGLLGTGDPGPPSHRAAHEAYLARRRTEQSFELNDVLKALISEDDAPRPRIPLRELIDAVESFRSATHPLAMLAADHPFTELRAARDRLVAWFAERGVDLNVDPEL